MLKSKLIISICAVLCISNIMHGQVVDQSLKSTLSLVANSDYVLMYEGTTEKINILNNDYGLLSGVKEVEIISGSENAEVSIEDLMIVYTPDTGFVGTDELKYKVCNNEGECDEAIVTIVVEDVDFVPVAYDDRYTIDYNEDVNLDVISNDESLFDLPISLSIISDLNHGFSTIESDLTLTLNLNEYADVDSILYEVCDDEGDCSQAWLYLDIQKSNSQKVFIPQGISPNGDGINDVFNIPDFDECQLQITLFNSNGVIVFKSLDYNNNWDGKGNIGSNKDQVLNKGIYYYVLKVIDINKEFTGFIYLN